MDIEIGIFYNVHISQKYSFDFFFQPVTNVGGILSSQGLAERDNGTGLVCELEFGQISKTIFPLAFVTSGLRRRH